MKRTHKGLMYGFVPVYLDMTDEDCPGVESRFYGGDVLLDISEMIFGMAVFVRSYLDPYYEPVYPIKITGEIKTKEN